MSDRIPSIESLAGNGEMQGDLFLTREILQRIELVRHLLENTLIVPLLVGPEGAGKSTLIDYLDEHAPSHWLALDLDAARIGEKEPLIALLGEQLGLGNGVDSEEALAQRLDGIVRQARMPVVLVDNAHCLREESLALLLRLADRKAGGHALLKIVLFSEDDLADLLNLPSFSRLADTRFQRMEMPRFSFGQAQAFVRARYSDSGQRVPAGLSFEKLYAVSGGWPGEMIQRADTFLKLSDQPGVVRSPPSRRRWPWLLGGALAVLLGTLLWFQDELNEFVTADSSMPPRAGREERPRERLDNGHETALPREPASVPTPLEAKADRIVEIPVAEESATGSGEASPAIEEPPAGTDAPASSHEEPAEPPRDIVDLLLAEDPGDKPAEAESPSSILEPLQPPLTEGSSEPKATGRKEPSRHMSSVEPANQHRPADSRGRAESRSEPISKPAHKPTRKVVPKPERKPASKPKARRWLDSAPPGYYTLQLMGASRRPDIHRLALRFGLDPSRLHIVRTERKGRPWYVVVRGLYRNSPAARKALRELPAALRKQGVWPRRVDGLKH